MGKNNNNSPLEETTNEKILNDLKTFVTQMNNLESLRLPQRAYTIIRHAIRNLVLPPGRTILEREVAEALGMSRTPVREALVRLEMDDALELIPRRGFFVAEIEIGDLNDIYRMNAALDGLAIEIAASNIDDKEIDNLEEIVNQQEIMIEKGKIKEWAKSDDEFHYRIIELSQNDSLNKVLDIYSDKLFRARLFTIDYRPIPKRSILEHKAMISCLRAQDGKAARNVMESHRQRAHKEIIKALETINQNK
ncbi:GntR family transcriptional regulator [Salinicoccus sp. Marseille-QA3877]